MYSMRWWLVLCLGLLTATVAPLMGQEQPVQAILTARQTPEPGGFRYHYSVENVGTLPINSLSVFVSSEDADLQSFEQPSGWSHEFFVGTGADWETRVLDLAIQRTASAEFSFFSPLGPGTVTIVPAFFDFQNLINTRLMLCGINFCETIGPVVVVPPLAGDCNGDGIVNADDLACICGSDGALADVLAATGLLLGDLDGNGEVAFADFLVLSANFGQSVASYAAGDIDCNGEVAFADFLVLSANFGKSGGMAANLVPEPSHVIQMLVASVCGLSWAGRRRPRTRKNLRLLGVVV